jgi:hypothetical protein
MTDRRRLAPIVNRRRIKKVFGIPPAALPVAKILTPSRCLPRIPPSSTARLIVVQSTTLSARTIDR